MVKLTDTLISVIFEKKCPLLRTKLFRTNRESFQNFDKVSIWCPVVWQATVCWILLVLTLHLKLCEAFYWWWCAQIGMQIVTWWKWAGMRRWARVGLPIMITLLRFCSKWNATRIYSQVSNTFNSFAQRSFLMKLCSRWVLQANSEH